MSVLDYYMVSEADVLGANHTTRGSSARGSVSQQHVLSHAMDFGTTPMIDPTPIKGPTPKSDPTPTIDHTPTRGFTPDRETRKSKMKLITTQDRNSFSSRTTSDESEDMWFLSDARDPTSERKLDSDARASPPLTAKSEKSAETAARSRRMSSDEAHRFMSSATRRSLSAKARRRKSSELPQVKRALTVNTFGTGRMKSIGDIISSRVNDWNLMTKEELIHRKGVQAPPMVLEHVTKTFRAYYRMLLPQQDPTQTDSCLYCRRKRKVMKFRFSLSEIMTKRGNPYYVGKMKRAKHDNVYYLRKRDGTDVADIAITSSVGKHSVKVTIRDKDIVSSEEETSEDGCIKLSGVVQKFLQPRISVKVVKTSRTVLEVLNPSDSEKPPRVPGAPSPTLVRPETQGNRQNKFVVEFNYPLTVFISMAIVCAVESTCGSAR
eukprot:713776_1